MAVNRLLSSIVGWLRAGYPEGDHVSLIAVLARRLTPDEVRAVAVELTGSGQLPIDDIDIGTGDHQGHRRDAARGGRGPGAFEAGAGRLAAGRPGGDVLTVGGFAAGQKRAVST